MNHEREIVIVRVLHGARDAGALARISQTTFDEKSGLAEHGGFAEG
jgi:hypothetical protein